MRLLFRILVILTLGILFVGRLSPGRIFPPTFLAIFLGWFSISVFVFAVFGLRSAWLAWKNPESRRAYLADVILAAAWIPYWYVNLKR